MWDFEVWYVKTRQDELRRQVAACMAAQGDKEHRPPWHHRWLRRLGEFLTAWGLWAPALRTPRLAPVAVRRAQQKQGGSNVWQHR